MLYEHEYVVKMSYQVRQTAIAMPVILIARCSGQLILLIAHYLVILVVLHTGQLPPSTVCCIRVLHAQPHVSHTEDWQDNYADFNFSADLSIVEN